MFPDGILQQSVYCHRNVLSQVSSGTCLLYTSIQTLDITKLDEPYQKLGRGLQVLERTVEEMLEYAKDRSVGNWKKYRKV